MPFQQTHVWADILDTHIQYVDMCQLWSQFIKMIFFKSNLCLCPDTTETVWDVYKHWENTALHYRYGSICLLSFFHRRTATNYSEKTCFYQTTPISDRFKLRAGVFQHVFLISSFPLQHNRVTWDWFHFWLTKTTSLLLKDFWVSAVSLRNT